MKVRLSPFHKQKDHQVHVDFNRENNKLSLIYTISGDLAAINLPPLGQPMRKDELWKSTCFELFLGIENGQEYLEFNISPSGDWNIYHFDSERQGMKNDSFASIVATTVEKMDRVYRLNVEIDLEQSPFKKEQLTMGISCITHFNQQYEYWAVIHPNHEKADFHHPEGRILTC